MTIYPPRTGRRNTGDRRAGTDPRANGARPRTTTRMFAANGATTGSAQTHKEGPTAVLDMVVDDDFVLRRLLARGSESIAYVAEQRSVADREVVVKLPDEVFQRLVRAESGGEANIYHREIRFAALARHPAFAHIYRAGNWNGRPYIAMEYITGSTLREHLKKNGPLDGPLALSLIDGACGGISALHANQVVHRDLKPSHVILQPFPGGDVHIRLLDLGHAKSIYQSDVKTHQGLDGSIGTPGYMPPEQAQGKPGDERSDVFALGFLFYEALAGLPAIHIEDPTPERFTSYVLSDAPLPTHPLTEVRKDLPPGVARVLGRALERTPQRRYANVRDLQSELVEQLAPEANGRGKRSMFRRLFK